ncbi:Protein BTG3 [Blattella germanica]|nr:Protein BTG3 [Blattella germanica]
MLDEISAAVIFLVRLIEKSENFNQEQLDHFKERLSELLVERFENHWFPDQPCKGQGYRCIRVNERDPRDATLAAAAVSCGFKYEDLKLPVELTIWVDPNEVCCRFGEHKGSYCTLASFSDKENITTIDGQLEKIDKTESKLQLTPLSTSNQHQGSNGKKNNVGGGSGSPKQNKSGPRPNKSWGNHNGNLGFHHFQSWYNVFPQWIPTSPPPYHHHPLLRSPPNGKWTGHLSGNRIHWHNHHHNHHKATLKV